MRDPAPTAAVQVIGPSGGAGRGATGQRGPSRGRRDGPGRLPRSSAWWGWARGAPALISPAAARGGAQATGGRMCGMCQAHLPTPGEGRGRGRPRGGAGPEPRGRAGANLFVPLHRAQSCLLPPARSLPCPAPAPTVLTLGTAHPREPTHGRPARAGHLRQVGLSGRSRTGSRGRGQPCVASVSPSAPSAYSPRKHLVVFYFSRRPRLCWRGVALIV